MKIVLMVFLAALLTLPRCTRPSLFDDPPKERAQKFAPERVSSPDKEHGKLTVSPDGRQMLWDYVEQTPDGRARLVMGMVTQKRGSWGVRQKPPFTEAESAWSACFLDDHRLLFVTKRDVGVDSVELVDEFWLTEMRGGQWSEPKPQGFTRFTDAIKWTLSATDGGTLYFDARCFEPGQYGWGIYMSRLEEGGYADPVLLPPQINTPDFDWTPFIAPDESFLLFASNRPGGLGSTDIWVAFRNRDGSWSDAVHLDDRVNSSHLERYPSLSPDGKILFFQRDYIVDDTMQEQDYYWIDAGFIQELKPDDQL